MIRRPNLRSLNRCVKTASSVQAGGRQTWPPSLCLKDCVQPQWAATAAADGTRAFSRVIKFKNFSDDSNEASYSHSLGYAVAEEDADQHTHHLRRFLYEEQVSRLQDEGKTDGT